MIILEHSADNSGHRLLSFSGSVCETAHGVHVLDEENQDADNDHGEACPETYTFHVGLFPFLHFIHNGLIRRYPEHRDERDDKDQIVEHQITQSGEIRDLIVQEPDDHQVRTAHTRKLTDADERAESECGRYRSAFHEPAHCGMRCGGSPEFDREFRKKLIQNINDSERDQERCSKLAHEVRRVEEMQNLEYTDADQEICHKDPRNVHSAYFHDLLSRELHAEQERDRDKQDGK